MDWVSGRLWLRWASTRSIVRQTGNRKHDGKGDNTEKRHATEVQKAVITQFTESMTVEDAFEIADLTGTDEIVVGPSTLMIYPAAA